MPQNHERSLAAQTAADGCVTTNELRILVKSDLGRASEDAFMSLGIP